MDAAIADTAAYYAKITCYPDPPFQATVSLNTKKSKKVARLLEIHEDSKQLCDSTTLTRENKIQAKIDGECFLYLLSLEDDVIVKPVDNHKLPNFEFIRP